MSSNRLVTTVTLAAGREWPSIKTAVEGFLKIVRKVGMVLGVAVLTSAGLFVLGVATSSLGNMGWIHLGEYQPWLPLIGLEYGFPLGIIIGVIVAVKKVSTPNSPGSE